MSSLTIKQNASEWIPGKQSYRLVLEVTNSEDIPKEVFVKQRTKNFVTGEFDDVFVAIATPTQIEDLEVDAPAKGTSYFRTNKIDLVSRNIDYIDLIKDTIMAELDKLVDEWDSLNNLSSDVTIVITGE